MPGYSCACRAKDLPTHDIGPLENRVRYRLWLGLVGLVATAFVACSGGSVVTTPLPTTAPTTVPTNTPNSTLKVTPTSLTLTSIGAQAVLTATQRTPVALTSSGCTGVAVVSIGTVGASTPITVTAAANGSCTLVVQDATNQRVTIPITVSAPVPVSPTPIDANHVAFVVKIASAALSAAPNVTPSAVNIYITGQQTTTGANAPCSTTSFLQVTDAQGDTAAFSNGAATAAPIPFYGGATTSGLTSQVIQLPALCSARIYISVNGPLAINTTSGPAPWAFNGAAGFPNKFDVVEYTMPANGFAAPSMLIDTTQENMIGLAMTMNMTGTQFPTQTTGFKAGFMTQVSQAAAALPSEWATTINAQWPTRLLSPLALQYVVTATSGITSGNSTLPGFDPGNFLDIPILTAWDHYQTPNCMNVTVSPGSTDALHGMTVIGQVDGSNNFNFYDPAVVTTCAANLITTQSAHIVAEIPSPFDQSYWINNIAGGWPSATAVEFMENGPFLLAASYPHAIAPNPMTFPNATYQNSAADIGNTVATALNRGVFDPMVNAAYATQPYCPSVAQLYPTAAAATQNLWATVVWAAAKNLTYGFAQAYAIPYEDKCGFSTSIQDSHANVVTITVNPN
jgi:hypothetical protein